MRKKYPESKDIDKLEWNLLEKLGYLMDSNKIYTQKKSIDFTKIDKQSESV